MPAFLCWNDFLRNVTLRGSTRTIKSVCKYPKGIRTFASVCYTLFTENFQMISSALQIIIVIIKASTKVRTDQSDSLHKPSSIGLDFTAVERILPVRPQLQLVQLQYILKCIHRNFQRMKLERTSPHLPCSISILDPCLVHSLEI